MLNPFLLAQLWAYILLVEEQTSIASASLGSMMQYD